MASAKRKRGAWAMATEPQCEMAGDGGHDRTGGAVTVGGSLQSRMLGAIKHDDGI